MFVMINYYFLYVYTHAEFEVCKKWATERNSGISPSTMHNFCKWLRESVEISANNGQGQKP